MATTLNGVTLPLSLQWSDEFSSSQVSQTAKKTLDGNVVVYYGQLKNGRPITLESVSDGGWVQKSVVDQLQLIANTAGGVYTLSLRGVTYSVMFRHHEGVAFEARPVIPVNAPVSGDYYLVKICLMVV